MTAENRGPGQGVERGLAGLTGLVGLFSVMGAASGDVHWGQVVDKFGFPGFFILLLLFLTFGVARWVLENMAMPAFRKHMSFMDTVAANDTKHTNCTERLAEATERLAEGMQEQQLEARVQTKILRRLAREREQGICAHCGEEDLILVGLQHCDECRKGFRGRPIDD